MMLTAANKQALKDGFPLSSLPSCFRDAVTIVRKLNLRYLWIDALCIMQDSEDDWAAEAALMARVYRGGVVTIAACDVRSSYDPIFTDRDIQLGQNFIVQCHYTPSDSVPEATTIIRFTLIPDWTSVSRKTAPLYQRGWVLQEKLLNRKSISFSRYQRWECSEGVQTEWHTWENGPIGSSRSMGLSRDSVLLSKLLPGHFLAEEHEDETGPEAGRRWWLSVLAYTICSITVPRDKPITIAGIAQYMSSRIRRPYYAGIWGGEYLVSGLLWRTVMRSGDNRCPTYRVTATSDDDRQLVRVLYVEMTLTSQKPFGEVSASKVVLSGCHLIETVDLSNASSAFKDDWFDEGAEASASVNAQLYFLPVLNGQLGRKPYPRRFIAGLILERASSSSLSTGTFQRVDMLPAHDNDAHLSLKASFWDDLVMIATSGEGGEVVTLI